MCCEAAILVVNNIWCTWRVDDLLGYELVYRYTIPHGNDHRGTFFWSFNQYTCGCIVTLSTKREYMVFQPLFN